MTQVLKQLPDGLLDFRQVTFNDVPDLLQIHTEVFMNEDVPHRDYLRPRYNRMRLVEISPEPRRCFANDLEVMHDPDSQEFVLFKGITPLHGVALDTLDSLQNILESDGSLIAESLLSALVP